MHSGVFKLASADASTHAQDHSSLFLLALSPVSRKLNLDTTFETKFATLFEGQRSLLEGS